MLIFSYREIKTTSETKLYSRILGLLLYRC